MTARVWYLLGVVFGGAAVLATVNILGYLIAGDNPGYSSAQGGANLYFLLSLLAFPFGSAAGVLLVRALAARQVPRGK